jgi:hypothetical protein
VLLKYYVDIPYAKSGACSPFVLALFILHENLNKPKQTGQGVLDHMRNSV